MTDLQKYYFYLLITYFIIDEKITCKYAVAANLKAYDIAAKNKVLFLVLIEIGISTLHYLIK